MFNLNIQIDFLAHFYPAYEQRLFNCDQFGLTPPLNIYFMVFVLRAKIPLDFTFLS